MTHDELLAKIDSFTCCSGVHEVALRAVVELHKPFDFELAPDVYKLVCTNCQVGVVEQYPCQTIQAIEKELG
jgi:hypothetical protein